MEAAYQKKLEDLKKSSPNWKFLPDMPKAGESRAFLAIHKDVDERAYKGAYIVERTLMEILSQLDS